MYRKFKRCLCFLFSLLTILICVVPVGAVPPMMSPGIGPSGVDGGGFVSAPSSIDISFYSSGVNSYLGYCVDPLISVKTLPASAYMTGSSSVYYYNTEFDQDYSVDVYYDITSYEYYSDIVLNTEGQPIRGEVRLDSSYFFDNIYTSPSSVKFTIRDFYSWTDATNPNSVFAQFNSNSNVRFSLSNDSDTIFTFESALILYSEFGSDEVKTLYIGAGQGGSFDRLDFHLEGSYLTDFDNFFQLFYIHSFEVTCLTTDPLNIHSLSVPLVTSYCFYDDYRNLDIREAQLFDSENPAVPLLNYTAFLGTAVSGFLDLQIFPNFTLGGILMTVIAFVCVIWFLKIFAGG